MKNIIRILLPILVLSLILTYRQLNIEKLINSELQKQIDHTFYMTIGDSMDGISKDYSKLNDDDKIHYYYKTVFNLKNALDMFYITSYKENSELLKVLNRLYLNLVQYRSKYQEINSTSHIFEFLAKVQTNMVNDDLIEEFNNFLDNIRE